MDRQSTHIAHGGLTKPEGSSSVGGPEGLSAGEGASAFLSMAFSQFVPGKISDELMEEILGRLGQTPSDDDLFVAVCVGVDISYAITHSTWEGEMTEVGDRLAGLIAGNFPFVRLEDGHGGLLFLVKSHDDSVSRILREIADTVRRESAARIHVAVSRPHRGFDGIRKCCGEAAERYEAVSNQPVEEGFAIPDEPTTPYPGLPYTGDGEIGIVNALRRSDGEELAKVFADFVKRLPGDDASKCRLVHYVMLRCEFMLAGTYGFTEEIASQFRGFYSHIGELIPQRAVNLAYDILKNAIDERRKLSGHGDLAYNKEYIQAAVAYIDEHLAEEDLSIGVVATYVYLNPVYFGRAFKAAMGMTFKQYLLSQRMERAKRLIKNEKTSIATICEQVGIGNPSYFSHLFKEYTGMLPSEYKKQQ